MSKIRTATIDKNGKATHVWRNPDMPGGNKSFDRLGNIVTQFVALGEEGSTFKGISYSADSGVIMGEENMLILDIPEMSALLNILQENPIEWGAPRGDTRKEITFKLNAGWVDGQFLVSDERGTEIAINNNELYALTSSLGLYMQTARDIDGYTQTHGIVGITRSPISDRDENYFIGLGKDAMLTTYIADSGLSEGDFGSNERDEVTFFRKGDSEELNIQISYTDDVDISEQIDLLDDDAYEEYKQEVSDALAEVDPRLVPNFDSPEDVGILFNDVSNNLMPEHKEGQIEFTTSNILPKYSEPEHMKIMNDAWVVFRNKVSY